MRARGRGRLGRSLVFAACGPWACGAGSDGSAPEVSAPEAAAAAPDDEAAVAPPAVALRSPYKHALEAARRTLRPEDARQRLSELLAQVHHEREAAP